MQVRDLHTPALVIDGPAFEQNLATMATARPGTSLRPHVKAHKCTTIATAQYARGHTTFCGATPRELIGLAHAGLGDDLLLANQSVDPDRLRALAALDARVTVAIDSEATIDAAARAGLHEVLVDVNVGMPRCGCAPDDAGRIADLARARGLTVRGVMGYEGHAVGIPERVKRAAQATTSMELLRGAHALVGGDVISAGGTGTFDVSDFPTEIQAGSYALMDTAYAALGLPFANALHVVATVISVSDGYAVADCGLKALGMDHGNPTVDAGDVWFCSDEHVTFAAKTAVHVGDRVLVTPAHVDPTVAYHERFHIADGPGIDATVTDEWAIDLRGW
jgi:D-serine deaminase-like pyridoxal phosphate-dependent protein